MDGQPSTLRNRFNTSFKDDKENKSEFEFSAPSLIVADDLGVEDDDQCDKPDFELKNDESVKHKKDGAVNLINLEVDIDKNKLHAVLPPARQTPIELPEIEDPILVFLTRILFVILFLGLIYRYKYDI